MHYCIHKFYKVEDELVLDKYFCSPADFIRAALKKAKPEYISDFSNVLTKDMIKNIATFKKKITKEEIYNVGIALHLNFTQVIQLMRIAGYTFTPVSKYDLDSVVLMYMANYNGFKSTNIQIYDYFDACNINIRKVLLEYEIKKRTKDYVTA